ncbi:CoA pyrophosphatase [Ruoffia tabacinasalis]|uniref:CoA pyrophosphatase n=1 Tax=Ruoffia tabacinasalis TaxID=87458 RepID=A0A5R9DXB6_9LACT|nr:CoA pyrophosphatase [Ruoffia tabacinasalis]TLQ41431.1 CoA pyrophosphatase [Ruoffia tabacinasalis]
MKKIRQIIQHYDAKALGVQRGYAVLLPLIKIKDEWHVLYEVRSKHISQPGETSFPGGRIETDESPEEAAVRETMEELNIQRENINLYGEIDYIIAANRIIYCYVGEITGVAFEDIYPNIEVERLFTIPLDHLMENRPTLYQLNFEFKKANDNDSEQEFPFHLIKQGEKYPFNEVKQKIPFYHIPYKVLWGFTANFTDRFIQIITDDK